MKHNLLGAVSTIAIGAAFGVGSPVTAYAGLLCGAGVCTESVSLGSGQTDLGTFNNNSPPGPVTGSPVVLNQFNPATGHLLSVTVQEKGSYTSSGSLTNNGTLGTESFTFSIAMRLALFASNTAPSNFPTLNQSPVAAGTHSYNLAQGSSTNFSASTSGFNKTSGLITANLPAWTGTGTFDALFATLTSEAFTGGGGQIGASLNTYVTPTVVLTYNYSTPSPPGPPPVPEPASLTLLGAGLAGLGVIRRRRRKS